MPKSSKKSKKPKKEDFSSAVNDALDAMFLPDVENGGKVSVTKAKSDATIPVDKSRLGDDLQSETLVLSEVEGTHGLVSSSEGDNGQAFFGFHGSEASLVSESPTGYINESQSWQKLQKYLDDQAAEISAIISSAINFSIDLGVIFGSGLSALKDRFTHRFEIPTSDLPGWLNSPSAEEDEKLILGQLNGKGILITPHRIHSYEGFNAAETTLSLRVMRRLGARLLITTNAAGSISSKAPVGRLMLLNDHINFMLDSPLRGLPNPHINMIRPYDYDLISQTHFVSSHLNIRLGEGVYVAVNGPEFETVALATYLRRLGGDVVGMSTVPEVIMARYLGMKVLAISAVTNESGGMVEHEDVLEEAGRLSAELDAVLAALMPQIRY